MLRLSAPAHLNASLNSRERTLRSSINGIPPPLRGNQRLSRRELRQVPIACTLENRLGQTGRCIPKLDCVPSGKELEERFGQAGVKFLEAAGYKIVEMRLNDGSSARIVLQTALIASYKSRMWHGGNEEFLHAAVEPGVERPVTVGGVGIRVWEEGGANLLEFTECWHVESVRSNPSQFVQITLSTTSNSQGSDAGAMLEFKYVITLTKSTLSSALITTNVGSHPVSMHGSFETRVAVNFVDGSFALGLQGYEYRSGPHGAIVVEEEDMVRMQGGIDRVYTNLQDSVSLLDRGKRRTVQFNIIGFEDVRISNPGEKSGLEDWDSFVCMEFARLSRPVQLQPGEEWRAAVQLENPST